LLRERAGRVGVAELRRQTTRYGRLVDLGADTIELSALGCISTRHVRRSARP
jgi:hypothetical protein